MKNKWGTIQTIQRRDNSTVNNNQINVILVSPKRSWMWRKRFPKIRGQVVSLELESCNAPWNIVWLWPEWLWRRLESTFSLKIIFLSLGGGGVQVGFKIRHWIPTPWPPPLICHRLLQGFEGQARHFMNGQCKSAKWTQIRTCYEGYMRRERHPGSNVNFQWSAM